MQRRNKQAGTVPGGRISSGSIVLLVIVLCVDGAGASARGQVRQPEAIPGWYARYTNPAAPGTRDKPREFAAVAPGAAIALEPGESVHPAVAPGGFEATFDSVLTIDVAGKYRFGAEFEGGSLEMTVFGAGLAAPVGLSGDSARPPRAETQWIDLPKGRINVQVIFRRKGDARARLRTVWEKQGIGIRGFRAESVPIGVATVPVFGASQAASASRSERGRVLLGELGCVNCHAVPAGAPVLSRRGPILGGVAARADPQWLIKWITDPQEFKPGCGMPAVGDDATDARAIVHYLASLVGGAEVMRPEPASEPADGDAEKGARLYETVGCIACHGTMGASRPPPAVPGAPLSSLSGKWHTPALGAFLADPLATRPAGRMPSLNLTRSEADSIAAYLATSWLAAPSASLFIVDPSLVEAGRKAIVASRCLNCHDLGGEGDPHLPAALPARRLSDLRSPLPSRGCLDPRDRATPRYRIAETDRAALAVAVGDLQSWLKATGTTLHPAPLDHARLTIRALGCRNCHEHSGEGGVDAALREHFVALTDADLGDEGRIPPRLDGVGEKLNTPWLRAVLLDHGRARPYMATRMPRFGAAAVGELAAAFAAESGVWPTPDAPSAGIPTDVVAVEAGRKLVGVAGLNCISCHVVGDHPPAGTPGADIAAFAGRLRRDWWTQYVLAPQRYKPGTKMPTYYERGIATLTDIAGGDVNRQIDAMWAYFQRASALPPPEGVPLPKGLAIQPAGRPVVLRTFLKDAGSRAIAVGFPESMEGVHLAFDAEHARLAYAWKGAFLDATGAWAGRGGTVTSGQGPTVWTAPPGPALVIGDKPEGGGGGRPPRGVTEARCSAATGWTMRVCPSSSPAPRCPAAARPP